MGGVRGLELRGLLYLFSSLNVSGLYAGYTSRGAKTIAPSHAVVKVDIRSVPRQSLAKLLEKLKKYLEDKGFGDVEIRVLSSYPAGYTRPSEAVVQVSVTAAREVYGKDTGTVVRGFTPHLCIHRASTYTNDRSGVGYYGSRVHAPNKNVRIEYFARGIEHVALTFYQFAYTKRFGKE